MINEQKQRAGGRSLRRGVDGVCARSACECEREGLGDQCIWLRPTDAELERSTGEPYIDGYPLYSGLPPAAERDTALLRRCLQEFQSFESGTGGLYQGEFAEIIAALRERLGEKE